MSKPDSNVEKQNNPYQKYEKYTAWRNFVNTIKSKDTVYHYKFNMNRYFVYSGIQNTNLNKYVLKDRKLVEKHITDYLLRRQDKDGVRPQTVSVELACIKHFFVYNDRPDINWKVIRGYLKECIKVVKDHAYTTEEIQKMLTFADLRGRCLILLMASTGMRVGAIPLLKLRDLQTIKEHANIYGITVYRLTPDEYITYCTPECKTALDAYLDQRRQRGETLTPDSPLIRERFDFNKPEAMNDAKTIHRDTIVHIVKHCAINAGLRVQTKNRLDRKSHMLNHAFRKFFFKACGRAKINPIVRELLMGHKVGNMQEGVTKLMVIYDATEDNELLKSYITAIEFLTITDEHRAKVALAKQEIVNQAQRVEIDQFKIALAQLQEQGVITLPK